MRSLLRKNYKLLISLMNDKFLSKFDPNDYEGISISEGKYLRFAPYQATCFIEITLIQYTNKFNNDKYKEKLYITFSDLQYFYKIIKLKGFL